MKLSFVFLLPLTAAFFAAPAARGVVIMENFDFNSLSAAIPDGNPSGLANNQSITSSIMMVQSVVVTLDISGSFNGDLYAYLTHGSGFSVLLNRAGKTSGNPIGYADGGFNITLDDSAANNIHTYQDQGVPVGTLTGTWQPDGRNIDPDLVLDSDLPTAPLASLTADDPNGDWTLFVADLSGGGTHTLNSWSMVITGDTVPEPGSLALMGLGLLAFLRRKR